MGLFYDKTTINKTQCPNVLLEFALMYFLNLHTEEEVIWFSSDSQNTNLSITIANNFNNIINKHQATNYADDTNNKNKSNTKFNML